MYQNYNAADARSNRVMSEAQFNQVIEAIISGKYSWACLLVLRFAGYNPLHYIPYRTYNRLIKMNKGQEHKQHSGHKHKQKRENVSLSESNNKNRKNRLKDLCFVEELKDGPPQIKGGSRVWGHLSRFTESLWQ